MPISDAPLRSDTDDAPSLGDPAALTGDLHELLDRAFGASFAFFDGATGELLSAAPGEPSRDWGTRAEVIREVAHRGRPEFLDEEGPFLVLALPMATPDGRSVVAAATFVSRRISPNEDLSRAADALGMHRDEAVLWAGRQTAWPPDALQRLGQLILDQAAAKHRIKELEKEAGSLSVNLASTYEEISLLYRLTHHLKLSEGDEELGRIALEWMDEVLPARGLAIQLVPVARADASLSHEVRTRPRWIAHGECPIDGEDFLRLIGHLKPGVNRPLVVNRPVTDGPDWPCPTVRQLVVVSLAEGENHFGWLAAINHRADDEFGTVEASLLGSVAAILGIHSGNHELYRQQSELLAGIIRALTSAIDAKDPYTCGHSDRVARVAVRIAEEIGCDAATLNTMYLSGLLHDIGKIGVEDSVLRKPGKLSEEEYEHIKRHVEIGHRILRDLGKLDDVLPVVLHHHESWDGGGYPHKLDAERIPLSARIVAVADAFDAMGSDRPYRKGMPDEKIDNILRAGAGQQWDPEVVDAFFRARDDIREICGADRTQTAAAALQQA